MTFCLIVKFGQFEFNLISLLMRKCIVSTLKNGYSACLVLYLPLTPVYILEWTEFLDWDLFYVP